MNDMTNVTPLTLFNFVQNESSERFLIPVLSEACLLWILQNIGTFEDNMTLSNAAEMERSIEQILKSANLISEQSQQHVDTTSCDWLLKNGIEKQCSSLSKAVSELSMFKHLLQQSRDRSITSRIVQAASSVCLAIWKILNVYDDVKQNKITFAVEKMKKIILKSHRISSEKECFKFLKAMVHVKEKLVVLCEEYYTSLLDTSLKEIFADALLDIGSSVTLLSVTLHRYWKQSEKTRHESQLEDEIADVWSSLSKLSVIVNYPACLHYTESVQKPGSCVTNVEKILMAYSESTRHSVIPDVGVWIGRIVEHSLTVACLCHICQPDYKYLILNNCRRLIEANRRATELSVIVNARMSSLQIRNDLETVQEIVKDELVELEENMNLALVGLIVDVFTQTTQPMENLAEAVICAYQSKSYQLVYPAVSKFLHHSSQICQIALLVAACSSDPQGIKQIELTVDGLKKFQVKAIMAVRTVVQKEGCDITQYMNAVMQGWCLNLSSLLHVLYDIMEPEVFMEISGKEIHNDICLTYTCLERNSENKAEEIMQRLINRTKQYSRYACQTINNSKDSFFRMGFQVYVNDLNSAINSLQDVNHHLTPDLCNPKYKEILATHLNNLHNAVKSVRLAVSKVNHPDMVDYSRKMNNTGIEVNRLASDQLPDCLQKLLPTQPVPRPVSPAFDFITLEPDQVHLSDLSKTQHPSLTTKSDNFDVGPSLTTKSDNFDVGPSLTTKSNNFDVGPSLTTKSDNFDVGPSLTTKSDNFDVRPSLTTKSDNLDVGPSLTTKSDNFDVGPSLTTKSDNFDVGPSLTTKSDNLDVGPSLTTKSDNLDVGPSLTTKSDNFDVGPSLTTKSDNLDVGPSLTTKSDNFDVRPSLTTKLNILKTQEKPAEIDPPLRKHKNGEISTSADAHLLSSVSNRDMVSSLHTQIQFLPENLVTAVTLGDKDEFNHFVSDTEISDIKERFEKLDEETSTIASLLDCVSVGSEKKKTQSAELGSSITSVLDEIETCFQEISILSEMPSALKLRKDVLIGQWIVKMVEASEFVKEESNEFLKVLHCFEERAKCLSQLSTANRDESLYEQSLSDFSSHLKQLTHNMVSVEKKVLLAIKISPNLVKRDLIGRYLNEMISLTSTLVTKLNSVATGSHSSPDPLYPEISQLKLQWAAKMKRLTLTLENMDDVRTSLVPEIKKIINSSMIRLIDYSEKKSPETKHVFSCQSDKSSRQQREDNCDKSSRQQREDNSDKSSRQQREDNTDKSSRQQREDNSDKSSRQQRKDNSDKSSRQQREDNSDKSSRQQREDNSDKSCRWKREDNSDKSSRQQREDNSDKSSKQQREDNHDKSSRQQREDNSDKSSRQQREDNSDKSNRQQREDNSDKSNRQQREDNSDKSSRQKREDNFSDVTSNGQCNEVYNGAAVDDTRNMRRISIHAYTECTRLFYDYTLWTDDSNAVVKLVRRIADDVRAIHQFCRGGQFDFDSITRLCDKAESVGEGGLEMERFLQVLALYAGNSSVGELLKRTERIVTYSSQLVVIANGLKNSSKTSQTVLILLHNCHNLVEAILQALVATEVVCLKGLKKPLPDVCSEDESILDLVRDWQQTLLEHRANHLSSVPLDELGLRRVEQIHSPSLTDLLQIHITD